MAAVRIMYLNAPLRAAKDRLLGDKFDTMNQKEKKRKHVRLSAISTEEPENEVVWTCLWKEANSSLHKRTGKTCLCFQQFELETVLLLW